MVGLSKISFPSFKDIALRYIGEVSSTKKSFIKERYIINALMNESWAEYPIHKINPCVIGKYRDKHIKRISGSSVNRSLDAISTIFTTCKKEWGYPVSNPVTSIRRPKKAEPRNRRFTNHELDKLIKGNRASPSGSAAELPRSLTPTAPARAGGSTSTASILISTATETASPTATSYSTSPGT